MDPLVKKVVDTGISKGVDFDKIASAMYNSGAGENQVLQAQEYYNQVKKKSPSVAGVSPSISGRTPSSSGFGPFKVKGQGDPNDPSGLYGQVEEANRRINTANRIYNVLSKKGDLSPKEIESARKDYQEYRSFYPNLPIDPSEDVGLLTDNIARDRTNIKAKSQPDESNYRKWMDYIYQSQPGGENGFLATILRGTEKVAGDIVSLGGAINDATDAFYSSVFGEETAENYKKTFKDTPLEAGAISRFGKGMAEQWNENTKKIASNWGMTEEQYEKGPGEALLEGDFSTAGKGIAIGLLHTMPELVATAVGLRLTTKGAALAGEAITANLIRKGTPKWIAGAAGRARAMAPTTLPLYTGANYAEVLDDPEFTTGEKLLYAVGSAVGSTLAESVGGFGEYFLGGAAKKQAVDQVKSSIMKSIGRGTVDMLNAAGVEGAEEVLDGGIQQALGIALGDRKFDANSLLDGFLIGAAMGGGTNLISKSPSLIGLSSDMLTTIKITDELSKIQTALSDPSLSDVERDLLTNRARVANNEIRRAKNSAAIFFQGYTPEDLQETMTLNSEIRRQIDSMPSFKTDEAKSAAIQSVKDSVARLKQIESKYDSQKKQQVQGAVQAGAQPGGVPVEGAGTEATAPGGVLQNVGQTQEEQVAQQRTEQASAFNVRPRLKKMKVTAKNAPGAYRMMMDALSNYTDEFLQQNKTDRASVERGIKSLFDVISSLDAKGRTVEIDVMGSIDEANKLFGFEINEVDGKFKVSSKIPGANRVFDTKEGADAYTKRVLYRGVNMMSDGGDVKISVLLPAMLDNTGYHEALHSLEVFDDKSADKLVVSLMNAIKKLPVLDGRMIAFMESYRGKPEPERNSEYLAELGSMISSGEISVEIRDSVIKSLTKSFLDFFKNMIGSDVDVTPTAEQLARTFNDIAERLGRGEKQPPYRKTRKKGEESGAVDRAKVRFQGIESEISNLPTNEQKRAKELFQLIGENAELTQDVRDNLQVARYMEDDGKDVENIRMATGWERGKDGMWRYEIQDLEFKKKIGRFEEDLNQVIKSAKNGNLEQYDLNELIDSDLFYFYPSLNNTSVILSRRLVVGFQDVLGGAEGSYYKEGKRGIIAIKAKEDLTIEKLRLILVHEIQHAIQDIENFAKGNYGVSMQDEAAAEKEIKLLDNKIGVSTQIIRDGNDSFLSENINELSDSEKSAYKEILDYSKSASMPILDAAKVWDKIWKKDKDTQKNILKQNERYVKTAGEVESRNVEARIGMTPEQRREITLEKTEDVSRAEQIVFFDNSYGQAFQSIEASQPKLQRIFADVIDGLYSPLENNILQSKQDKMPAKQWLDKFARTDEAYWTGLQEWLGNKQGSVSKQEIMDWLKDNRVEIRERVRGDIDINKAQQELDELKEKKEKALQKAKPYTDKGEDAPQSIIEEVTDIENQIQELEKWAIRESNTKYSQYQLEGDKENYKELLVTLPIKLSLPDGKYIVYADKGPAQAREYIKGFETDKEAFDWIKENEDKYPYTIDFETRKVISEIESGNVFKSTHFPEKNILVHLRMNTRTDVDGNKVLFLEEVQSDWGQKGRKEGFEGDKAIELFNQFKYEALDVDGKKLHTFLSSDGETVISSSEKFESAKKTAEDIARRNAEFLYTREVPKAPFVTDTNAWTKLGLKIALREAVRQDADRLAWTTGEQQNDRYDLSKQIDYINVIDKKLLPNERYVDISLKDTMINVTVDKKTGVITSQLGSTVMGDFKGKGLDELIGKDLADKVMLSENGAKLEGEGLKVGGKGMKGFYDKIVPDAARAIVRELTGVQGVIDETKIELSGGDVSTQKSIDITPELKAAVQSGVPKFQLSGMSTNKFTDYLSTKYGVNLDIVGSLGKDGITLSRIIVPKENRKSGIGSSIMNEIIDYADANNERILLTPSDSFGGNVERLKKFYKNLGFIENKGRNRDFTTKESMYRNPVPKAASNFKGLSKRLSGDALLNAQDLSNELLDNGAKIDADGLVTVYHRTTDDKKAQIEQSGIMLGLEDGLFFSTKESGQAEGYGDAVIQLRIPIEKLQLDDTFGDEAHVRIPTSKPRQSVDVSAYLTQPKFQRTSGDEISMDDFTTLSKRLNKFFKGNVKIVDADTFEKESEKFTGEKLDLKSYDGNVYGAVLPNGVMFINGLDVNSLLHEHTHLFNQVVMKVNPRLWSSIKEAVKKTAEWSQVKRNPLYSNLKTDDEVADEVFSKIVGNAAKNGWQKYTNQSIYQNIKALAQKFYNTILDLFGVDYYKGMSASGLADLTLTELMGGVSTTPYQVDAKINELMSKLLKGTRYLNQVRFNIDPNSRKKFEKALGEKDGRALYEIFGNVQDPSKLIDFAKSKFPIKGTLSSVAKRSVKDNNGDVVRNGNFGSIVVYKEYEKFLNKELEQVVDKATLDPQDLLNEVGYTLFNPTNLNDARNSFLHYYKNGHNICTLNPGSDRFSGSFVTFIVRNDADQTPSAEDLTQDNLTDEWRKYLEKKGRKNSDGTYNLNGLMPDALDPYSTSVISLQINKSNGSTKEISRYNHQIGSPDNIFSRDFDNLIEGLSDAMFKKFGVDKNTKQSTAQMPFGVIQDANGAYYNYIYETNGVYYGDGYYLENGVATLLDRGSERMVDGWVISNRGDGTATNIDRTTYGFFYGDVKKVNYIKGDEISLTTKNGNFVFEVKNGAVVKLIEFPKKWRLDKFKELGIKVEYDENGNLILSGLGFATIGSSDVRYTSMLWADDIVGISRTANFDGTKIQSLGNLQYIKGDTNFSNSRVQSLEELKYIGGYVNFRNSQVKSLGKLKYIGDDAYFSNSQIQSLGELKYVGGKANFMNSQVQSLGELKYIGGNAIFRNSQIQSLGELKYIRRDADFRDSQVQSLGELKYIMGNADFYGSQVQSLGELKYIGFRVIYSNGPIDSKAIEDIKRKSEGSTAEILVRDANDFKESMEREFEQFGKEIEEEFTESQPKFQTPIDEAFDKSQALLDAMSKRGGIITNLVVRFADRSSSLKKKLIEANLKNARDLFVAQAGAGSRAKFFIDENFSPIYNGLNKENSEYLDKIIQLRRIIQIDEDFDSKGKPRIIHPSDKNGVPLNKERAEANLVDYESMFGSALYNDLINRSDLYFDAYKKLLSIMRDNGLITKELYDNLKSLLYQPRKFLDQFVSFEEGETTLDVKDLALNEAQIKTLQNGSDSEIMMNSRLLLAFSAKSVFSRVARNKTYTAISEAVKDPANDWISNKQLKNFKPVNYFVDGVREQFFIREDYQKQLYDSTRHLISPNVARVMRVLTGSAILKSFATQVNPLFALKNFPRDVLHVAMFTNIYGNNLYPALFRISRDAFRGMHDKMSNSKDFKEWLEYGGGMDFLSTEGFESRSVRVGAFNKIRDAMSTFGEYSEVGVRLAVYKKTKADLTDEFVKTNGRGPNKEESDTIKTQAAVASREIIDFAQGGSWAKAGENIIPYLNASIQGFRVGANYIVKNPKDFAVKFAQLSLAVGVIMFYNSMMADDDEWEKIQDGEKMRNFIIFTPFKDKDGNRYYIKIAKTQQAIAWITFAEMMSAKMLNETLNPDDDEKIADKYKIYGDRTYDALVDGLMTFFPKNPLDLKKEITSAIPAINALAAVNNYDTFINKQVSYDYQKVPAVYEDILDPDIPYFYKALSQSIHPVMEIGPKRLGTAVEKITTGAETSVIVAGAYYLLDNVARKVANLKTDELNLGEVPKGDSELNAISSMFSPLKGVVKKVNPNLKKYQYSEDLDDIALRGASSIKTIKNASRNLGEKYYDALRGQGDLTKDEVLKEVKDYRDMLIEKGVQKSQVESFVNAFKMSAKSSPRESWDAGYYDIMYSPSSDATVEIISKLKGDNLTDAELKEYFINYKKSTGYNIKNMGEVYSLYRKSRDKK